MVERLNVMKYCYILLLFLACCGRNVAKPTNYLSIYLLANKADVEAALSGQANLADISLEPEPILADHDFTSYDTKSGEFFLKAEAAKRLSHKLSPAVFPEPRVHGGLGLGYSFDSSAPFVLEAMEQRIYVGVFSSTYSSRTYGCPVVMAVNHFIPASSTNDVGFGFAPAFDDKRIPAAVAKLSIITNRPSKNPPK